MVLERVDNMYKIEIHIIIFHCMTRTREFDGTLDFDLKEQVSKSRARKDKQPTVPYTAYLKN